LGGLDVNTKDMLFGIAIFAAGLLTGIFIGSRQPQPVGPPPSMAAPGTPPGGFAPPPTTDDKVGRIAMAQQLVARDPKNVQAWVQLGNDFFDTNQPQKSIEAYARALELQPDNPDVLTDQGVMYRAVGQFEKAIANFERAQKVAPTHLQSLINIAVVYDADLKKTDKAVAALEKVLQLDPAGRFGAQAKEYLAQIKARPAGK
jgi:cytochrome c-type biogenesis protein CcmH/NrfG